MDPRPGSFQAHTERIVSYCYFCCLVKIVKECEGSNRKFDFMESRVFFLNF